MTEAAGGSELLDLAVRIAERARPGEQVEAYVARGESTSVKAYGGEVESLTSAASSGVGIRVVVDGRQGFAHAGTLDESVIDETLADARDNASFGEVDEWFGLAEPDEVAPIDQDLWSDELVAFPTDRKVELALALERAVVGRDPRVTGVRTASYGDGRGEAAVATSTGVQAWGRSAMCSLSVSALAVSGDETKIGGGLDVGRDPNLLDVDLAADDAVERAVRLFGAKKAPSQRLAVVFEPRLAATLVGIAGGTLTGERVLKGRSPFADRMGEQIASPLLTLVDDPTDARSLAADSHDGEGLACRRNVLIEDGILRGFLHNAYTGRRAGAASTGSAVRGYRSTPGVGCQALAIAPGTGTHDEVLAGVDHGFYVASLTGLHSGVNAVSGDVSVGAEGLMVRDGALAEPVREVTLATTLQRLLLDVVAVGGDLEWLPGGTGSVTLVVDGVQLSGT
ncbi:MAG: TldD/PmbA family protein [Acidimicrobiales bacterium]